MNESSIESLVNRVVKELKAEGKEVNEDQVAQVTSEVIKQADGFTKIPDSSGDKEGNRVIITAFGINKVGILAGICSLLAELQVDIIDISQKIMQEFFSVILVADISQMERDFSELKEGLNDLAKTLGIRIFTQHEDVFKYMQRI